MRRQWRSVKIITALRTYRLLPSSGGRQNNNTLHWLSRCWWTHTHTALTMMLNPRHLVTETHLYIAILFPVGLVCCLLLQWQTSKWCISKNACISLTDTWLYFKTMYYWLLNQHHSPKPHCSKYSKNMSSSMRDYVGNLHLVVMRCEVRLRKLKF